MNENPKISFILTRFISLPELPELPKMSSTSTPTAPTAPTALTYRDVICMFLNKEIYDCSLTQFKELCKGLIKGVPKTNYPGTNSIFHNRPLLEDVIMQLADYIAGNKKYTPSALFKQPFFVELINVSCTLSESDLHLIRLFYNRGFTDEQKILITSFSQEENSVIDTYFFQICKSRLNQQIMNIFQSKYQGMSIEQIKHQMDLHESLGIRLKTAILKNVISLADLDTLIESLANPSLSEKMTSSSPVLKELYESYEKLIASCPSDATRKSTIDSLLLLKNKSIIQKV